MKLIKDAYHSWGAEVVFITSNLQGNTEMMEGCKEAGIPAFVSNFICVVFSDHDVILLGYFVGFLNKRKTSSVITSILYVTLHKYAPRQSFDLGIFCRKRNPATESVKPQFCPPMGEVWMNSLGH
jgi:hypothetical protein